MTKLFRNSVGVIGLSAALIVSTGMGAAFAEELSAEEMVRRFELQQQSRSLAPPTQEGTTRGLRLFQGDEPAVGVATQGSVVQQPSVSLDPIPYTEVPLEATELSPVGTVPTTYETVPTAPIYQQVAVETYQPVQDDARVDLRIYFEWNSAKLKPEAIGQLATLCNAIGQVVGGRVFKIIGHTDKSGAADYNLYLSEARAREVKRHLVDTCGVPRDGLIAVGEGERQADPNAPARDPAERRVEVQLVS